MRRLARRKITAAALLLCMTVSASGCATLKPEEVDAHGYHGSPEVKEGHRVLPVDWLGNLFGVIDKIILWNWKVKRHNITEPTDQAIQAYLDAHPTELGDVVVQVNRWAPVDSMKRLVKNKRVKWPYRVFFGFITVLVFDVLLIDRIFGVDRYNAFTHQVHVHSDLPSVALHELGHARDFAGRRYKGSYAMLRMVPFADLYQEHKATKIALTYMRDEKLLDTELEAYKILYPAFGTYMGGYLFGMGAIPGALIGHIAGRATARSVERQARQAQPAAPPLAREQAA